MEPTRKSHWRQCPGMEPYKYNPWSHLSHPKCFLEYVANKLDWETLPGAVFLDVGCGDARPQLGEWLFARFPDMSHTVAMDRDVQLVMKMAREYDGRSPIQFVVGNIQDLELSEDSMAVYDKVLSLNCFHQVQDFHSAFDNLFIILKPNGELGVTFCVWSGFFEWLNHLKRTKKWEQYAKKDGPKSPDLQNTELEVDYMFNLVRKRGFNVFMCDKIQVEQPYESEEECKVEIVENALLAYDIPYSRLSEFAHDVFNSFEACFERDEEGRCISRSTHFMVLARKSSSIISTSDTESTSSDPESLA